MSLLSGLAKGLVAFFVALPTPKEKALIRLLREGKNWEMSQTTDFIELRHGDVTIMLEMWNSSSQFIGECKRCAVIVGGNGQFTPSELVVNVAVERVRLERRLQVSREEINIANAILLEIKKSTSTKGSK